MEDIIRIDDVSYSYYDKIPALSGVSLSIFEGEKFAVIGSNGSGKSTLLQVMNGLIYPSSGGVFFRGKEVSEESLRLTDKVTKEDAVTVNRKGFGNAL